MKQQPEASEYLGEQQSVHAPEWFKPDYYDLNIADDRRRMYDREVRGLAQKHGRAEEIASELFELAYPDRKGDAKLRKEFITPIIKRGDRLGKWFYFSWSNRLVQYPDADDLYRILTFRNQHLITAEEQQELRHKTILHAGQSVGMKVLYDTVHMGVGDKLIISDPDRMSMNNLNRINAGMEQVGMRKTDIAAIHVSELNPYIKQIHYHDGITLRNLKSIFSQHRPDLMYEHVDHLPTKLLMRQIAKQEKVPLIMATDIGDYSLIDVERYDTESVKPFLGKLTDRELAYIKQGKMVPGETMRIVVKIIGPENISPRMAQSLLHIGFSLGGIAQLGTTASAGGAYAAIAGREILLNRGQASGRYRLSPQAILQTRYI